MTDNSNTLFGLISLKDFAKQLGKPESTVRTWRRRGEIPATCFFVIGSTVFLKVDEILQWIGQTTLERG